MVKELLAKTEARMQKTIEAFEHSLSGMRAGRAHPALLEKILIDYYGASTPLQHLAAISTPDSRSLVVQPFDKSAMGAIEKSIMKADIGVSVRPDGAVLRVGVPALNEERRRQLVKQLKRQLEDEKIALRNIRRDAVEELKAAVKAHEVSEDEERRAQADIQKITDRYVKELDQRADSRERDIMTP